MLNWSNQTKQVNKSIRIESEISLNKKQDQTSENSYSIRIINSMQKKRREENVQQENETKLSKNQKLDFEDIDKVLNQMQLTYKANIEAQQTYLDIVKCKNKNINSKYIKMIYALFTQNKANQICFEKEQALLSNIDFEDRLFRRYYARLIEMGIRKISYFWANNAHLDFLSPYILKIAKQIHTLFNDIYKIKSLDQHFAVLRMLYHENAVIQQKIYELLIQQGYILSMDEFYRINGVDLVADRLYEAKSTKITTPSCQQSESLIQSKKQSQRSIRMNKLKIGRQKQNKKQWAYSKTPTHDQTFYNQTQSDKNRIKIKVMLESMVKDLKTSIQQQKQANNLEVIEEQNDKIVKKDSVHLESEQQQIKISNIKTKRRIPKPENEYKRKVNQKKISIELMSYFSNQLKSAISEVQDVDIDCLSDLLMTSESNSKNIDKVFNKINQNQSAYIHSIKSLDSIKKIKQQKKRGILMEMALKKRNLDSISQMYDELADNYHLSFDSNSNKQKFSFRSAPGMYISLPKKQRQSLMKSSSKSDKKQQNPLKKLIIRQTFSKDPLFENQLIVNQLAIHQLPCLVKKVNITQGNENSLTFGITSTPYNPAVNKFLYRPLDKITNILQAGVSKKQKEQKMVEQKILQQTQRKPKTVLGNRIQNQLLIKTDNLNKTDIQVEEKSKISLAKPSKELNYVIYDRIRRRIILTK